MSTSNLAAAVSVSGVVVWKHSCLPRALHVDGDVLMMQYGGATASLGMAAPDAGGRFFPWSQFENLGDSGIVGTSPLAETTSTEVDDSGDQHNAQVVCVPALACLSLFLFFLASGIAIECSVPSTFAMW
jgi:hypothetical protein